MTVAASVGGSLLTAFTFSPEDGASFAIGSVGSVMYLSMLQRSVDSIGGGGGAAGALGSPRLLIPGVLIAGWNRWNVLLAPQARSPARFF